MLDERFVRLGGVVVTVVAAYLLCINDRDGIS